MPVAFIKPPTYTYAGLDNTTSVNPTAEVPPICVADCRRCVGILLQVDLAFACGARFVSSTHCDVAVVRRTKKLGMISIPGVSTPAQARGAVQAGGDIIKAFPSKDVSTECFRGIVESVPSSVPVIISGGVEVVQLEAYSASGASGFAVGRTLFEPEMTLAEIEAKACCFISGGRQIPWAPTLHATDPA